MKVNYIIGIDEAGRGPVAGPVSVGVMKLPKKFKNHFTELVDGKYFKDSKKLNEQTREVIFKKIKGLKKDGKLDFAVSMIGQKIVDERGISWAVSNAISKGIKKLKLNPKNTFIYLDGRLHAPDEFDQETLIKGDTKKLSISLASIVAKVTRDRYMIRQSKKHPEYGFHQHKGYGTKGHYRAIKKHGICELHRVSYLQNLN